MQRAATKTNDTEIPEMELGGEFPVEDLVSGEGGLLQVCMEGIGVLFADRKVGCSRRKTISLSICHSQLLIT